MRVIDNKLGLNILSLWFLMKMLLRLIITGLILRQDMCLAGSMELILTDKLFAHNSWRAWRAPTIFPICDPFNHSDHLVLNTWIHRQNLTSLRIIYYISYVFNLFVNCNYRPNPAIWSIFEEEKISFLKI